MPHELKRILKYWVIIAFSFLIIYAFSLTFIYVEGDDATTIAFHALGRNLAVQPPYAPYHGMMDRILGFLPADEHVLRIFGLAFTSAFAILFCILLLRICFEWLNVKDASTRNLLTIITLVGMPELFFFGLAYSPTMVAMSFILGSHLLIRHSQQRFILGGSTQWNYCLHSIVSVVLYGFGSSCRWSCVLYGAVIVLDLVLLAPAPRSIFTNFRNNTILSLGWGALALISVFLWIGVSGYDFVDIVKELRGTPPAGEGRRILQILGILQTVLSPPIILLAVVGIVLYARDNWRLLLLFLFSFLSISPFLSRLSHDLGSGTAKFMIFAIPALLAIVLGGALILWNKMSEPRPLPQWIRYSILLFLIGPWFVGLKVYTNTSWGPGFQITPVAESELQKEPQRIRIMPALDAGMAMPTPEGPRPLYGYAYVLFGKWRKLITEIDQQKRHLVDIAIATDRIILQDDANNLIVIELLRRGFTTRDPSKNDAPFNLRSFINVNGGRARIVALRARKNLYNKTVLDNLERKLGVSSVLLFSGYTSTISKVYSEFPRAAVPLGYFSMDLNLKKLRQSLAGRKE